MYEYFDFDYSNAVFEWDDEKAEKNFFKHGIKFETAAKVFADENKMIREDEEHLSDEEQRYNVLGKVGKIIFVVCVFKTKNVVRLISARLATKNEIRRYEHGDDLYE
ncbi:MAG: BrnT family toxin [Eubacterium sp.]|nr:BrnT family toxin [Eubacterium sp.]